MEPRHNEYLERIYSGFLGMNIGIRLGAPVEPTIWTSDRIERFYGDITDYVKPFRNFAADDDANGPVFFLRALDDGAMDRPLEPGDVAEAWLNYAREGIGMFWWGGYGVSTEHTAYLNLKNGIKAPASGSVKVNGRIMAEQIGGQIFIDTWGLVCPGDPARAARYARIAASVSHDGNALEGAAFIAACIAEAFCTDDVDSIIEKGLSVIDPECDYAKVVNAVIGFHSSNPGSWRKCLKFLQDEWGYDKWPGACHIIPNAGVCIMAMLYGRTFSRTVEIATMAGWDTDCNAGNVGTIMGVANGLEDIPDHYRKPVNDAIVLSGISGYLNILDIPTYARKLAETALRLKGEPVPEELTVDEKVVDFDFSLPGSTHCMRVSNEFLCRIRHVDGQGTDGKGALEVLFDRGTRGDVSRIYYKPFYRRADFDDERYQPVFSPRVYPGQHVSMKVRFDRLNGESVILSPYVRNTLTGELVFLGGEVYRDDKWHEIEFDIPSDDDRISGAMIDEVGLQFEANSPAKTKDLGCFYIDYLRITGKGRYTIDVSRQKKEFSSIIPFSHNHGSWEIRDSRIQAMCLDHCEAMTGNYFMSDVEVHGSIMVHNGGGAFMSVRVQGARRGYYAGLVADGIAIMKNCGDRGLVTLAHLPFDWREETEYDIMFRAVGDSLSASVGGRLIEAVDPEYGYGMVGYAMYNGGRCAFGDLGVEEL